jgi:hypothetical protein
MERDDDRRVVLEKRVNAGARVAARAPLLTHADAPLHVKVDHTES